jgi:hypothetical protein
MHTLEEWARIGFPGDGNTQCGDYCLCFLEEVEVPESGGPGPLDPVPTGKTIRWKDLAPWFVPLLPTLGGGEPVDGGEKDEERGEYRVERGDGEYFHATLAGAAPAGKFDILAITAGVGNGWVFSPEVLRESLALWDRVECFVDHDLSARSVRDLAGVLIDPVWDDVAQGVRAQLKALGPSGGLLEQLGRGVLEEGGGSPRLGFSADVLFKAEGKTVTKISKVLSVDLVVYPARGGKFVRALNQQEVDHLMAEKDEKDKVVTTPGSADVEAVRSLLQVQQEQAAIAEEVEKARAVRVQMCGYLLTSGLAASKLPAPMAEQVRKQFAGRAFEATELETAIVDARKLVSDLTGGLVVQGPGRIHGMFNSADHLQVAVDDLLGAPRDADKAGLKAARLSGIRELYLMLTGDQDMHGGYHPERVQLATTADFAGLVKNALNKIVVAKWGELGRAGYTWWEKIATVEHFSSLNTITGTLVGTVGSLPAVAEGGEYTELAVGDSPETASFTKYGGYIPLTLELIDRDETRKLAAYPRELAMAGLRKISELVAAIFSANSGIGPTMADTGALFNATAVTSVGGHANLLTTALSAAQWETVSAAVYNQPLLIKQSAGYYGTGPKMGLNPRYMLVPRALQLTGKKILYPGWENLANITSENQQQGVAGDVITVPEWTDATDWAAVVDPLLAPAIFVGERFGLMPEVFIAGDELSPAVFGNDEHRLKVRHFLAVWVNDFRPLHKSNV